MQYCIVKYIWKSIKMYLFYGINEDNMWPNAEGRLIHFTKRFRVTNAIFMIHPARTPKKKKTRPRNKCININDLITFV